MVARFVRLAATNVASFEASWPSRAVAKSSPADDGIVVVGARSYPLRDAYHSLLRMRWSGVLAVVAALYLVANAIFAVGYTFTADATDWTDRFVLALRTGGATAGESGPEAARTLTTPTPNPTTGRSALTLRLAAAEHVTATVVDALGRTVATLYDAAAPAGADVTLSVDASRLAPGVYVVRVQGATFAETRRLTVVR